MQVCQQTLREYGTCRAVLANSGQANACTGDEGLENCLETRRMVAALTGLAPHEIMPMSTGVIGDQLRMDRWREAVPALVESLGSRDAEGFTRAFMTTDAFPKFASITVPLSGGTVRLTGMAKGAGMMRPNMATMLAVMLTDAEVDRETWQAMFARAVDRTFNRVSVDGDTSTNDTILGSPTAPRHPGRRRGRRPAGKGPYRHPGPDLLHAGQGRRGRQQGHAHHGERRRLR